jgi:protein-tyrosine-phosphatase
MTICIKEYEDDIKSAVIFMADQVMKDNPNYRQAYQHIIQNGYSEEVANWIIGDPAEASDEVVEVYYAIERAAKKEFKTRFLGVY